MSAMIGAAGILAGANQVAAKDVGDGGLPPGIAEFQRVLLTKKQWNDIGKRVETGHAEMDKKEWENVQGFLRKFYGLGDDMTLIAKAFNKDDQSAVADVVKTFRKAVKAIDKPAAAQDFEAFMVQHKEIAGYVQDFLDIRSQKKKQQSQVEDI